MVEETVMGNRKVTVEFDWEWYKSYGSEGRFEEYLATFMQDVAHKFDLTINDIVIDPKDYDCNLKENN
jgi:hypothetical protein